jgi:hypothetical protein
MARFGLISCFRDALEKSMITETNLIRLFLLIVVLNESIVFFLVCFLSATLCSWLFLFYS